MNSHSLPTPVEASTGASPHRTANAAHHQNDSRRFASRQILLTRSPDYGFGFTLRHFIVYPPDDISEFEFEGEEHLFIGNKDPLDTIFVKEVKPGSPAKYAGLNTGDRILSVNEEDVHNRSYQEIVSIIKLSPKYLRLVVIPKEHDILQQVFRQAAYNPESNLNIQSSLSPEAAAGSLSFSCSSSCSSRSSLSSSNPIPSPVSVRPPLSEQDAFFNEIYRNSSKLLVSDQQGLLCTMSNASPNRKGRTNQIPGRIKPNTTRCHASSSKGSTSQIQSKRKPTPTSGKEANKRKSPLVMDRNQSVYNAREILHSSPDHHINDKSKKESSTNLNSKTDDDNSLRSSEESTFNSKSCNLKKNYNSVGVFETVVDAGIGDCKRFEKDPDGRLYEVVYTRLIENSDSSCLEYDKKSCLPNTKSSIGSSAAQQSKTAIGSSLSKQIEKDGKLNNKGIAINEPLSYSFPDRPTQDAIDRIKKNVEKKEEFLKRPVQPIFRSSADSLSSNKSHNKMWPPPLPRPPSPASISKSLTLRKEEKAVAHRTKNETPRTVVSSPSANIQSLENFTKTPLNTGMRANSLPCSSLPSTCDSNQTEVSNSYSSVSNDVSQRLSIPTSSSKALSSHPSEPISSNAKLNRPFISTLARIRENIPYSDDDEVSVGSSKPALKFNPFASLPTPYSTPLGSQSSLTSLPATPIMKTVPLAWATDNERIRQLQIVSTRAKKFETYNAEKEAQKTAFYRFELSRLSQKANAFIVANRRKEFEKRSKIHSKDSKGVISALEDFGATLPRSQKILCSSYSPTQMTFPPEESWPDGDRPLKAVVKSKSDGGDCFAIARNYYTLPAVCHRQVPMTSQISKIQQSNKNRTIPVGGTKIHCDPPNTDNLKNGRPENESDLFERMRANSTCSHDSFWPYGGERSPIRRKKSPLVRQHSFHSTLHSHLARAVSSIQQRLGASPEISGSEFLHTESPLQSSTSSKKEKRIHDHDKLGRRVSYLRATCESPVVTGYLSDSEVEVGLKSFPLSLSSDSPSLGEVEAQNSHISEDLSLGSPDTCSGFLHFKLDKVNKKRAGDRSWKSVWAVIRAGSLLLCREKPQSLQTPLAVEEHINLRSVDVAVAADYTKRRHVFRLCTPVGSQILLQADSDSAMTAWINAVSTTSTQDVPPKDTIKYLNSNSEALPGSWPPTPSPVDSGVFPSVDTPPYMNEEVSKPARKSSSASRTKSPPNRSISQKSRKSTSVEVGSPPKSKTWKGRLGRHLRKMQGSTSSSPSSSSLPEGASVGVCLEDCPPSPDNEFIPLLVSLCVGVVEAKGLRVQGVYRIPGNRAAVTNLIDAVNRGTDAIDLTDPRWSDVNVISSLLKQFFQKLPDPLITSDLYSSFIEASKLDDSYQRLIDLKHLVQELPDHHYETLRYLCFHLHHVTSFSADNKMDVRNLAIVFGPTLVRAADDNMTKMVTDMSHQCRIVELLISQVNWFFSDDDNEEPPVVVSSPTQNSCFDVSATSSELEASSQSLLLGNVQKLEAAQKDSKKLLVSSIISAANRRVQKSRKKTEEDMSSPINGPETNSHLKGTPDDPSEDSSSFVQRRKSSGASAYPSCYRSGRLFDDACHPLSSSTDFSNNSLHRLSPFLQPELVSTPISSSASSGVSALAYSNNIYGKSDQSPSDDMAIRSYAGLNASTQERIRKFELETRAMLQRETQRHRKELIDKQKLEEQLQKAKRDLENEDIFDRLADNPSQVVHMMNDYCWSPNRETVNPPLLTHETSNLPPGSTNTYLKGDEYRENNQSSTYRRTSNDGSDLLSAINATFEQMRESSISLLDDDRLPSTNRGSSSEASTLRDSTNSSSYGSDNTNRIPVTNDVTGNGKRSPCKLYRDPSLHRRRIIESPSQTPSPLISSSPIQSTSPSVLEFSDSSQVQSGVLETEDGYKEKTEKRCREFVTAKIEPQESGRIKKAKELKRSDRLENVENAHGASSLLRICELRGRRHNVKELKAKFEVGAPRDVLDLNYGAERPPSSDRSTRASQKQSRRSRVKRRHTVGGVKDLVGVTCLRTLEGSDSAPLRLFLEALAEGKNPLDSETLNSWVVKEELSGSTPDLDSLISAFLPSKQKEALKRRRSVREPLKPLHTVLESNV